MGSYLSIITLNVKGLNSPTKRQRLFEWFFFFNKNKNKTPIYGVYKRPTSNLGTYTDWKWRAGKTNFTQMETKWNNLKHLFWSQWGKIRCQLQVKKKKTMKNTNLLKLNNALLNNQHIKEEEKRNQNMNRNEWKWKHNNAKPMGYSKRCAEGKVHNNTSLHK